MASLKQIIFMLIFGISFLGCSKQSSHYNENVALSDTPSPTIAAESNNTDVSSDSENKNSANEISTMTSVALLNADTTDFKLITTVDIKFKTNKVYKTLPELEKILLVNGGVVLKSSIESVAVSYKQVEETVDSVFFREGKSIEGRILVYVPKNEVYKVLDEMSAFATQIDSRIISSEDVTLDLLKTSLNRKRGSKKQQRVENLVATKTAKLEDALDAEETLDNTQRSNDQNQLAEFEINRKIKYTLLSVLVYQDAYYKIISQPQEKGLSVAFKDRLILSLHSGWIILSAIIFFFIDIWPITLILIFGVIFYFKKKRNRKRG